MAKEIEKEIKKLDHELYRKERDLDVLIRERDIIKREFDEVTAKCYKLDSIVRDISKKRSQLTKDLSYVKSDLTYKLPSIDPDDPDKIFKQCLRLVDITRVHHRDIYHLPEEETYHPLTSKIEEDMKKIEKILRISVEDLEKIVESVLLSEDQVSKRRKYFPRDMSIEFLKRHFRGEHQQICIYTKYGYVVRMLKFLRETQCPICFGICHKLHSCEKTFDRFPKRR